MRSRLLALALLFTLSGCGLFGEDDLGVVVTGRVVLAETGEPIADLGVALIQGSAGFGVYFTVATARTGSDGGFRVEYNAESSDAGLALTVNDEPYNSRYTLIREYLRPGEDLHLGTVVLCLNES